MTKSRLKLQAAAVVQEAMEELGCSVMDVEAEVMEVKQGGLMGQMSRILGGSDPDYKTVYEFRVYVPDEAQHKEIHGEQRCLSDYEELDPERVIGKQEDEEEESSRKQWYNERNGGK